VVIHPDELHRDTVAVPDRGGLVALKERPALVRLATWLTVFRGERGEHFVGTAADDRSAALHFDDFDDPRSMVNFHFSFAAFEDHDVLDLSLLRSMPLHLFAVRRIKRMNLGDSHSDSHLIPKNRASVLTLILSGYCRRAKRAREHREPHTPYPLS